MNILINIDDYDREWIANGYHIPDEINRKIAEAIIEGTPLPKNHGDLIDRNELLDKSYETVSKYCSTRMYEEVVNVDDIKSVHAIIKADKEDDLHEDSD